MRGFNDTSQISERASEQLKIGELLLAEAHAKRKRGETIEAMELREEARARRHAGLAMLDEATAGAQRFFVKEG